MDQDRWLFAAQLHFGWAIQFHCRVMIAAGVPVCPAEAPVARFASPEFQRKITAREAAEPARAGEVNRQLRGHSIRTPTSDR